jgi:8-oxo-dGTP pyrophosphatase MutT (NUDIX family)
VHRDGDWHGALHIWVGGVADGGRAFAVFQRRSLSKDTWPGTLDVAVGGHLRAGETIEQTVREAEEEIGLVVSVADLTRLGRRFARGATGLDNEVQQVFALRSDLPLDGYVLHPEEVAAIVSVPLDEVLALFEGSTDTVEGLELARGARIPVPTAVTVAGFAAGEVGGYAVQALRGLGEVVRGSAPEPFELR